MKKAICVESKSQDVTRVLSIAEPEIIDINPTGLEYFLIDDYAAPPEVANPSLDICYPLYDNIAKQFKWIVVNYQYTVADTLLEIQNLNSSISILQGEKNKIQEVVDTLLANDLTWKGKGEICLIVWKEFLKRPKMLL